MKCDDFLTTLLINIFLLESVVKVLYVINRVSKEDICFYISGTDKCFASYKTFQIFVEFKSFQFLQPEILLQAVPNLFELKNCKFLSVRQVKSDLTLNLGKYPGDILS